MCHGVVEARCDTVLDDVNEVMVRRLRIDIKSIDIVQVFLNPTSLLEIAELVTRPVWLAVVAIVLPNGLLDFFSSIEPVLVTFPPFQCISLST